MVDESANKLGICNEALIHLFSQYMVDYTMVDDSDRKLGICNGALIILFS